MAFESLRRGALVAGSCCAMGWAGAAVAYDFTDSDRWGTTFTDGGGLGQGDPTTLTWSIVPDGTTTPGGGAGSDLISYFDGLYGNGGGGSDLTQRPWFFIFEQSFNRYTNLSGLTMVYLPNDNGNAMTQANKGAGRRGDIRIGGRDNPGVLASAFFPEFGEITINTSVTGTYANTANASRAARNVIMHEIGHSLGIEHVESNNAQFLYEPSLNTSFDGLQLDDILALHRGYGDKFEKTNNGQGNETPDLATHLGTLQFGVTRSIGTKANDTVVGRFETDFVSLDDNSDRDVYSFTISDASTIDITLTPKGPTYNSGPQGGSQSALDTSSLANINLQLFDTDGQTILTTSGQVGRGITERIEDFTLVNPGTYYARATSGTNAPQLYQLDLLVTLVPLVTGDLNRDLVVDEQDLAIILSGFGSAVTSGSLIKGDPTGDGRVTAADLNVVLSNWTGGGAPVANVPEPGSLAALSGLMLMITRRRR